MNTCAVIRVTRAFISMRVVSIRVQRFRPLSLFKLHLSYP